MNSPHTHPRATEWLTVVQGKLETGFMLENGFLANPATGQLTTQISTNLTAFQGTVFPMGSIHYQYNPTCEKAVFVASLNSEDAGTSQIAQNFFGLNGDVVSATLGFPKSINGKDIAAFKKDIPANVALAIEECVKRCYPEKNI